MGVDRKRTIPQLIESAFLGGGYQVVWGGDKGIRKLVHYNILFLGEGKSRFGRGFGNKPTE